MKYLAELIELIELISANIIEGAASGIEVKLIRGCHQQCVDGE
jgi:hypothetical protein